MNFYKVLEKGGGELGGKVVKTEKMSRGENI